MPDVWPDLLSEGGIKLPDADYLRQVQVLCKRYGTLFVLDEVQTGMFRTGKFLAAQHFDVQPDVVILGEGAQRRPGPGRRRADDGRGKRGCLQLSEAGHCAHFDLSYHAIPPTLVNRIRF